MNRLAGEDRLVLAALRPDGSGDARTLSRQGRLCWQTVIRRSADEGAAGLLYVALRGEQSCPDFAVARLAEEYYSTWAATLSAWAALEEIGARLNRTGARALLLPGASLLPLYGDYGLRPMDDLDLLVNGESSCGMRELLGSLGYRSPGVYSDLFERDGVVIDLHTDLFNGVRVPARRRVLPIDHTGIWTRARHSSVDGILVMAPVDSLLYLCGHAMKHSFNTWFWFGDILRLIALEGGRMDWDGVIERSDRSGLRRALCYTFLCIQGLFGLRVPERIRDSACALRIGCIDRLLLQHVMAGGAERRFGDLLFLSSIKGAGVRLSFLKDTYFPPAHILRQVFPALPAPLVPAIGWLLRGLQVAWCGSRGFLRIATG